MRFAIPADAINNRILMQTIFFNLPRAPRFYRPPSQPNVINFAIDETKILSDFYGVSRVFIMLRCH